jgi:hypothetical protein
MQFMKSRKQELSDRADDERRRCKNWLLPFLQGDQPKFLTNDEIITTSERDNQVKVVVFDSAVDGFFLTHYDFLAPLEESAKSPPGPSGLQTLPDMLVRLSRAPVVSIALEARIGQKNKITRRSAKRGTRPSAPRDQRTASKGKGAALILPACNIEAINLHLAEIALMVAPGAHAVLLVDQAGWHLSARLVIPANMWFEPATKSPTFKAGLLHFSLAANYFAGVIFAT